ncbi:unnamed protein product [Urochloa decumbens]|uniref:Uncharacterized protein n=1 Tax=Urochloa decumbens TaxID=240449 RepID=A0ABC9ENB7_9POAL
MDEQNTGHPSNSIGTATMTAQQRLMREEAELKKQIEAEERRGEEQKARIENFDQKLAHMLNGDFEGIGYEELKIYFDKLVEIQREIKDRNN